MSKFAPPFDGRHRSPFTPPAPISAQEYDWIRETVYQNSRINLGPSKKELVMARLSKRLRALGLSSYREYIQLLQSAQGKDEMTNLIDSISTNHTYFFREPQHFDFLLNDVLPQFCPSTSGPLGRTLKVWSAATSTGEEPYSIAILLDDYMQKARGWNWRILCTDISTKVLKKAQNGVFAADKVEKIKAEWLRKYFEKGSSEVADTYRASMDLRRRMQFISLNLLAPSYPFTEQFQLIFCRNVMIYFDKPTQQELVQKLSQHLEPGGYLIIGHAESLTGVSHDLKLIKPSIYRKP